MKILIGLYKADLQMDRSHKYRVDFLVVDRDDSICLFVLLVEYQYMRYCVPCLFNSALLKTLFKSDLKHK